MKPEIILMRKKMGQLKSKGRANHLSGVGNFKVEREKVDIVERRINKVDVGVSLLASTVESRGFPC